MDTGEITGRLTRRFGAGAGNWCGRVRALILQRVLRGPLGIMAGLDARLGKWIVPTTPSVLAEVRSPTPLSTDLARALTLTVDEMWKRDYMQEWHGFTCVDAGEVEGRAAMPLADHIEAETGWRSAWPLPDPLFGDLEVLEDVSIPEDYWAGMEQNVEDQVFDLIEYFHGHVSEGLEDDERSSFHSWEGCGWHYNGAFDPAPAQALFRQRINRTLSNIETGTGSTPNGQIEHTAHEGFDQLLDAALPDDRTRRSPKSCGSHRPVSQSRAHRGGLASCRAGTVRRSREAAPGGEG